MVENNVFLITVALNRLVFIMLTPPPQAMKVCLESIPLARLWLVVALLNPKQLPKPIRQTHTAI